METTIQKWGNSQGLRIPRQFLTAAHPGIGDQVSLAIEEDSIIIRKAPRKKYDLAELVAQIPKGIKQRKSLLARPSVRNFGKCPSIFHKRVISSPSPSIHNSGTSKKGGVLRYSIQEKENSSTKPHEEVTKEEKACSIHFMMAI